MSTLEYTDLTLPEVTEQTTAPILQEKFGEAMEVGGDLFSISRGVGTVLLVSYIHRTPDYQSWKLAGAFLVCAATDLVDGYLGRAGRKLQGKDESVRRPFKSYLDHLTDKGLVDAVSVAVGTRERDNGNTLYGNLILASAGIFITRDVITTSERILADINDIDTRAKKSGKMKTLKQCATLTLALSPITKTPLGKLGVGTAFASSAKDSIESGIDIHNDLSSQRAILRKSGQLRMQRWRNKNKK